MKAKPTGSIEELRTIIGELFDAEYYLATYGDVKRAGIDPLEHYLSIGWREGRNPSATFNSNFYIQEHMSGEADGKCPLVHYAKLGQFGGFVTNEVDDHHDYLRSYSESVERLLKRHGSCGNVIDATVLRDFVSPMFCANWYRRKNDLKDDTTILDCYLRYLVFDFPRGASPGPLFDGLHYARQAERAGLPAPEDPPNSYLHWLDLGVKRGICPVAWFDEEQYLALNSDLADPPANPFMHFVRQGLREGRFHNPVVRPTAAEHPLATSSKADEFVGLVTSQPEAMEEIDTCLKFWRSDIMSEICNRATAIDPQVQRVNETEASLLPHWHDHHYRHFELISRQLQGAYEHVVLMPFCKLGGADFVASVLANSLAKLGNTIVLRTDLPDWMRPDWFSPDITSIDLSSWLQPIDEGVRERMLYEVIRKLRPRNVFNVNSRLAFGTFENFGARLQEIANLHSYYFCADRLPDGREVGYPVDSFANVFPFLKTALFDNQKLSETLTERYCLPDDMRTKMSVIYTPAAADIADPPMAARQLDSRHNRTVPTILWAGRFDRQKRFDLLVRIAAAMPEVLFKCWGTAVLDPMPPLDSLPHNLMVHPPYQSHDELPLEDCDGLLYTSAWDGIPNIIIGFGALGMPIVASAVGGVPELIDETTGWPVDENAEIQDYVDAINDMLESPQERVKRASELQRRVATRHNLNYYLEKLRKIAGRE